MIEQEVFQAYEENTDNQEGQNVCKNTNDEVEFRQDYKRVYSFVKRVFDIISSIAAMIILSPLYIIIALIVRSDGGPAIYKQRRMGIHEKYIYIYKFRSMSENAEKLIKNLSEERKQEYRTSFKITNDPRITKVGSFLRKTSLDELPQLFNILKGDMSVVGARPIIEKEAQMYGAQRSKFFSIKPGLTGYWQAYARNNVSYENGERQKMELYYVDNRSVWFDIKIIFKTVERVLTKDGAM